MNLPSISLQKMSSREIAQITGKLHKNVVRDIRNCEPAYIQVYGTQLKFELSEYTDTTGRKLPEYQLDKSQTLFLVSGYDSVLRAKIQKRWEELEREFQSEDAIILRSIDILQGRIKSQMQLIEKQQSKIEEDKPKVIYAESISHTSDGILIGDFAKMLCDSGFNIGQNRLFQWLRNNGYLFRRGNENLPYQVWIDKGFFVVSTTAVGTEGSSFQRHTVHITGKGQLYITNKLKESREFFVDNKLF